VTFPAGHVLLADEMTDVGRLLDPPRARLRQTTLHALTNAAFTSIQFQSEDYDTVSGHDNVTNNSRYTCQVAGLYVFTGKVAFAANATGQRAMQWALNGTAVSGSQDSWPAVAAVERQFVATTYEAVLAVNDYVELQAFQDSGGSLNTSVATAGTQSLMTARWVGSG